MMMTAQSVFALIAGWKIHPRQITAETADFLSKRRAATAMSDSPDNQFTFDQVDKSNAAEVRRYHEEKMEREAENIPEGQEPLYLRGDPTLRGAVVFGLFILGTIIGVAMMPASPEAGTIFGLMTAGAAWLTITRSGVVFRRTFRDHNMDLDTNSQQQQQSSSSKPKQICSNCGWRNPRTNNYCHDCGTGLDSE
ncbi:hypothetical protein [Haloplanus rubicundus]|uniref:hypothetical protein n=1 Tax=Haloplanus rubicundus TaxID=1547898 RepID=UPI001300872E|nr:hypothetical protein [Haloplanus rubicundus]